MEVKEAIEPKPRETRCDDRVLLGSNLFQVLIVDIVNIFNGINLDTTVNLCIIPSSSCNDKEKTSCVLLCFDKEDLCLKARHLFVPSDPRECEPFHSRFPHFQSFLTLVEYRLWFSRLFLSLFSSFVWPHIFISTMDLVNNEAAPSSRQRKASYRRQSSCPFLKKPVPRLNLDLQDQSSPNRQSSNPKRPANYNSIERGGDEPSEDTTPTTRALDRHLSLTDLIAIGVGGTVGSGFFVLAGLVSHQYAGPSAVISWLIAGIAACISGCCYAELSARIPLPGSTYAYSYVAMGELPAVLAAGKL